MLLPFRHRKPRCLPLEIFAHFMMGDEVRQCWMLLKEADKMAVLYVPMHPAAIHIWLHLRDLLQTVGAQKTAFAADSRKGQNVNERAR